MTHGPLGNVVADTSTTTGTGALNLAGSFPSGIGGGQTPDAIFADSDTGVGYRIKGANGEHEVGRGVLASGSPWTLTRADADVEESSNSDNRVNLGAGTHEIYFTPTAAQLSALMLPQVDEQAPTTSDITFTWNRTIPVDPSGLDGTQDAVITAPPFVGARARIVLTDDAPADKGDELRIIGDTGIDVGGAGAATEWSRLFINREAVTLYARSLTEIDIEVDGRIPQVGFMEEAGGDQVLADSVLTQVEYDTAGKNVGGIVDVSNNVITVRRTGTYIADAITNVSIDSTAFGGCYSVIQDDQASPVPWSGLSFHHGNLDAVVKYPASAVANVTDLSTSGASSFRVDVNVNGNTEEDIEAGSWLGVFEVL